MKQKITAASVLLGQLVYAGVAKAATLPGTVPQASDTDLNTIIGRIIDWVLGIAGAIALLFLIIGGVRYIISAGNPTQTEGAKKTIIYALVGLVVIILAYVLIKVLFDELG